METEKLKEFIEFMNDNQLCELEVEEEGKRIRLKKYSNEHSAIIPHMMPVAGEKSSDKESKNDGMLEIKSPMVGTFYRAPSPGAQPYVDVGSVIKPGDVVCIIEAMKLMNEIKAEVGGKLTKIFVENGEPAEFGQPLFLIEPV